MSQIIVTYDQFVEFFPELAEKTTEVSLATAYRGAPALISINSGEIILDENLQEYGVYLATAHIVYLRQNPDSAALANVSSANQYGVSVGYQLYSDPWKRYLSASPYGLELLGILMQVQPSMPSKPRNILPYYGASWGRQ